MLSEFNNAEDFAAAIAAEASAWIASRIKDKNVASVALAGGSTPELYFQLLGKRLDEWDKIKFFWADERIVPHDNASSNYALAKRHLFAGRKVNCFPVDTSLSAPQAAKSYAETLMRELPVAGGVPVLDLAIIGAGADGHVASLFADNMANADIVVTAHANGLERISVGMKVLQAARKIIVAVSGKGKEAIIERIKKPAIIPPVLPVDMLRPDGRVSWVILA